MKSSQALTVQTRPYGHHKTVITDFVWQLTKFARHLMLLWTGLEMRFFYQFLIITSGKLMKPLYLLQRSGMMHSMLIKSFKATSDKLTTNHNLPKTELARLDITNNTEQISQRAVA